MTTKIDTIKRLVGKNYYAICRGGGGIRPAEKNKVNINSWVDLNEKEHNFGDLLSDVIVKYVADLYGIDINKQVDKTKHLYAVGSILMGANDATIWGSGFIDGEGPHPKKNEIFHKLWHKTDVRAVRGPETKKVFDKWGISCPDIFGDPGILLSKFYAPKTKTSRKYIVIPHFSELNHYKDNYPVLSPITNNWQETIDRLCEAELIICSSLHAVIIAESYGIPAVLLNTKTTQRKFKFNDYYYSTNRFEYPIVSSVEEALKIKSCLPNKNRLIEMQNGLINSFPYDLWE